MNRYDILLKKTPPRELPKKEVPKHVVKPKKDYNLQIQYRATLNSLQQATKNYEAGEVIMAGSEPLGICVENYPSTSPYESVSSFNSHFVYCHGAGTVLSTNRVAEERYKPGDMLVSINGLLALKQPSDESTVVGVVLSAESDGTVMIQMRI